jgi:tricorn protease
MPTNTGYYRQPTMCRDQIVFVSEDDLWTVERTGGTARRLTSGLGSAMYPALSPDGANLAFSGREEGPVEAWVMPSCGGSARRLSFFGAVTRVLGWRDKSHLIVATNAHQPFARDVRLFVLPLAGGPPEPLPLGPVSSLSFGPKGGIVLGRNAIDPARWKRYRGGTAGDLLIDPTGKGTFKPLIKTGGNLANPMWIGDRIYFLSDHEGVGNLYSCNPAGKDLKRHTDHHDFYARFPSTDGHRIVYHAGGDLFVFDPANNRPELVKIEYHGPRTQRNRKFVNAAAYLESFDLHPQNHLAATICRGKPFTFGCWAGPVRQHGTPDGIRYRLARWLNDGKRVVCLSDADGEEALEIHHLESDKMTRLAGLDIGRATDLKVSPVDDLLAVANHRNELLVVDLTAKKVHRLDRSEMAPLGGFDWAPDGRWIAYGCSESRHTSIIKIAEVKTRRVHPVTRPVLIDSSPAFDPEGKYLVFLSHREFDPVYDALHFELGFPRGVRPYLITLAAATPSPFVPVPKPTEPTGKNGESKKAEETAPGGATTAAAKVQTVKSGKGAKATDPAKTAAPPAPPPPPEVKIDFAGIETRIQAFPVPDARYQQIATIKGKVLFSSLPIEGALNRSWGVGEPAAKATLEAFDFDTLKTETLLSGLSVFGRQPAAHRQGGRKGR